MSQTPAPIGSLWAINSTPHNGTATSREAAKLANEAWGPTAPLWKHARVLIEWVMPTKAYHPDPDNAMASLKAQRDGFADWGIVQNDKNLVPVWGGLRVEKTAEWPRGCVRLTFKRMEVCDE